MGTSKSSSQPAPNPAPPIGMARPSSTFQDYYNKMPASYFSNAPVRDPSSILNAYMQYMPKTSTQDIAAEQARQAALAAANANTGGSGDSTFGSIVSPKNGIFGNSAVGRIAAVPINTLAAPIRLFKKIF